MSVRSYYYDVEEDDVQIFNRLALTLMRLDVCEYFFMNMWEERYEDPHFGDEYDIFMNIMHVSCSAIAGDEVGDYDIR